MFLEKSHNQADEPIASLSDFWLAYLSLLCGTLQGNDSLVSKVSDFTIFPCLWICHAKRCRNLEIILQ